MACPLLPRPGDVLGRAVRGDGRAGQRLGSPRRAEGPRESGGGRRGEGRPAPRGGGAPGGGGAGLAAAGGARGGRAVLAPCRVVRVARRAAPRGAPGALG